MLVILTLLEFIQVAAVVVLVELELKDLLHLMDLVVMEQDIP